MNVDSDPTPPHGIPRPIVGVSGVAACPPDTPAFPAVGDWVRVERDETRWPSKGTWPRYRGKVGRVVRVNPDYTTEYGVRFTADTAENTHWFVAHEVTVIERPTGTPNIRTSVERQSHSRAGKRHGDEKREKAT